MNYNYKRNKAIIDLEKNIEILDLFNPFDYNKYDIKNLLKNNCGDDNKNILYLIKELNNYKKYLENINTYKLMLGSFQVVLSTLMNILQEMRHIPNTLVASNFTNEFRKNYDIQYQSYLTQINNLINSSEYNNFYLLNGSNKINKLYISSKKKNNQYIYFKTLDCSLEGLLLKNTNLLTDINNSHAIIQINYAMDRVKYYRIFIKGIETELNKYEKLYKSKSEYYLQKFIDWKSDKREELTDQINNIRITLC